jgi:hypothetical protein
MRWRPETFEELLNPSEQPFGDRAGAGLSF